MQTFSNRFISFMTVFDSLHLAKKFQNYAFSRSVLNFYFSLLNLLFFISCNEVPQTYPGFTRFDGFSFYKLQAFGESNRKANDGEYLKLAVVYKTETDSIFLTTSNASASGIIYVSVMDLHNKGALGKGILGMDEGDSTTFIVKSKDLFDNYFETPTPLFLDSNKMVKVETRLIDILDESEYLLELQQQKEMNSVWEVEEHRRIRKYIAENKETDLSWSASKDGLYIATLIDGDGIAPVEGMRVTIKYSGHFIGGQTFDSTPENSPFEFSLGDEKQVIEGLHLAIKHMKSGEKAKFIIPSYLAFGEHGSSSGIVPPNATVIYEVELINVN